jgi:hypothetical protein
MEEEDSNYHNAVHTLPSRPALCHLWKGGCGPLAMKLYTCLHYSDASSDKMLLLPADL